jgi:hypothetical protein
MFPNNAVLVHELGTIYTQELRAAAQPAHRSTRPLGEFNPRIRPALVLNALAQLDQWLRNRTRAAAEPAS